MRLRCIATLVLALSPLLQQCMCAADVVKMNNFHDTFLAGLSRDWPCQGCWWGHPEAADLGA